MSFPRYPAYKDSGVEWLGEVPAHWDIARLKFVAHVQTGVAKGKDNTAKSTIQVPYLRVANVQDGYIDLDDVALIEIPETDLPRYQLQAGDVLMNEGGDFDKLGRGHIWDGSISPCIHQNHVFAVRPHGVSPEWLNTVTGSKYAQFYFMSRSKQSTNLASISSTNVMELPVVMPPQPERQAIASFLTRETAKIDALVAEQEKLITLLKEKRQAVISHAVTKGLDPSVPMKDSGVEWLGEVPAHWEVRPVKHIADIGNGATPNRDRTDYWTDGDYPWLSSTVVNQDIVQEADEFVTQLALAECHLPRITPPAVLIGITGQGKTRGMAATLAFETTINQHIAFLKPKSEQVLISFLRRYFDMAYEWMRFESDGGGSTKGAITCDQIANMRMPYPSSAEQKSICGFLDQETIKFDALVAEAQSAITLLQERRTALISAAVTGQIKVTPD